MVDITHNGSIRVELIDIPARELGEHLFNYAAILEASRKALKLSPNIVDNAFDERITRVRALANALWEHKPKKDGEVW